VVRSALADVVAATSGSGRAMNDEPLVDLLAGHPEMIERIQATHVARPNGDCDGCGTVRPTRYEDCVVAKSAAQAQRRKRYLR